MADGGSNPSDSDLALLMSMGDKEGLRLFLQQYGGCMKAYLKKYFSDVLQDGEMDEALNVAVFNIWRFANRYDERKGKLVSWCIRITQRAAQDIVRRETKYLDKNLEYDAAYDPAGDPPEDAALPGERDADPRLAILPHAIEKLPALQKAIIKADLAADGLADAARLAEIHATSKNSICVSRHKARENLKRHVEEFSRQPMKTRS